MTREEASFILANIDRRVCDDELSDALDMAIKALEQELVECEDAISRECVIEELNKINGTEEIFKVHEIIENAPSVQPKRIKGEWIESKYSEICSECKAPILCDNNEYVVYSNYCPNCGAKMRSEVQE